MARKRTYGFITAGLIAVWAAQPVPAAQYMYEALTEAPKANKQGAVRAGSLTWECRGNRCTISGPWAAPGVSSCQALAKEVGRLRSYGHAKAQLSSAQLRQCNSAAQNTAQSQTPLSTVPYSLPIPSPGGASNNAIAQQPKLMPGVKDVSKLPPIQAKVPGQKELVSTIGPTIREFSRISGTCPYPDPEAPFLRYRVDAKSPDGALVTHLQILRENTRGATQEMYTSPPPGSSSVRLSPPGIADPGVARYVAAYVLRATDRKGRTTQARLPVTWGDPSVGDLSSLTSPQASRYIAAADRREYNLYLPVRNISIESLETRLELENVSGSRTTLNLHPYVYRRIGRTHNYERLTLPSLYLGDEQISLSFRIPYTLKRVYVYGASGRGYEFNKWRFVLTVHASRPANCSARAAAGQRQYASVQMSGNWGVAAPPPESPPAPPTPPANDGYWWHVWCACSNDYQVITNRIRACMVNGAGAGIVCGIEQNRLTVGRCAVARVQQLDRDEFTCRAFSGNQAPDPE